MPLESLTMYNTVPVPVLPVAEASLAEVCVFVVLSSGPGSTILVVQIRSFGAWIL